MEGCALGAEDGTLARFKDRRGGFEEEEGGFGADVVELFYVVSSGVSAGGSKSILGADGRGRRLGEMEERRGALIRIVSSNADDFATIRCDTTRGHLDRASMRCLQWNFHKRLSEVQETVCSPPPYPF